MVFGLFKKKKKEQKDSRYLTLTVREVIEIAKDSVNLVFENPSEPFDYQPGQFITLIMTIDGNKIRRAYSLCTTPFEDEFPAVTVKRVPGGAMSNYVNDHVKAGDQIEVMEPMGMFTTEYDESTPREAIFFGGGSGITPLISLIRSILIKQPKSKLLLVYGNRSREYIAFYDKLNELKEKFSEQFDVIHILEEDKEGIAKYTGRPTTAVIQKIIKDSGFSEPTCYLCGPQPMMDVVSEGLRGYGLKDEQIRMESFESGKTSPDLEDKKAKASTKTSEVTILMDGDEFVIDVKSNESILEAGLENDLDMPYSCQSGLCTACRGKCLEGEISQEDAEGLSQEEMDEGYRLLCIGKPMTDKVIVEVG
ncbi:MAG: 2Fe-2S iron-sulfur cluster-binding protein [Bacteroidota bacterium]